jgi:hypothetical protein
MPSYTNSPTTDPIPEMFPAMGTWGAYKQPKAKESNIPMYNGIMHPNEDPHSIASPL